MRLIRTSYDIVTNESAAQGDFAECGMEDDTGVEINPDEFDIDEYGELGAVARDAVKVIGTCVEPSCLPFQVGSWYSETDGSTDYRTGDVKRLAFHLSGFTPEEETAIYRAIAGK